jgi:hypothetical protein
MFIKLHLVLSIVNQSLVIGIIGNEKNWGQQLKSVFFVASDGAF